jgi:hypothetical protein
MSNRRALLLFVVCSTIFFRLITIVQAQILVNSLKLGWTDANAYCQQRYGTQLVTIRSADQNSQAVYVSKQLSWIGLNDVASEGNYTWASGDGATYRNWTVSEPTGTRSENCVVFDSTGAWSDQACSTTLAFVCDSPPQPKEPVPQANAHAITGGVSGRLNPQCIDGKMVTQKGLAGSLTVGVARQGDTASGGNELVDGPCGLITTPTTTVYAFSPVATGRYRFTVAQDSSRTPLVAFIMHCNGDMLYSSGFYAMDGLYKDSCAATNGWLDTGNAQGVASESVLIGGFKYYVVITVGQGHIASKFTVNPQLVQRLTLRPSNATIYDYLTMHLASDDVAPDDTPAPHNSTGLPLAPEAIGGIIAGVAIGCIALTVLAYRNNSAKQRPAFVEGVRVVESPVEAVPDAIIRDYEDEEHYPTVPALTST